LHNPQQAADAVWFVNYLIHHVSVHKAGVAVYYMADASRFVRILKQLVQPDRVFVIHHGTNPKLQPADYQPALFKNFLLETLAISPATYFKGRAMKAPSVDQLGKLQVCVQAVNQKQGVQARRPKGAHII
jgi:hypothetical protein